MAPDADMPDDAAQRESCDLANAVPEAPRLRVFPNETRAWAEEAPTPEPRTSCQHQRATAESDQTGN